MKLYRVSRDAIWEDPWGIRLRAVRLHDVRDIKVTKDTWQHDTGYGVVTMSIWEDEDGNRFRQRASIDPWGGGSFVPPDHLKRLDGIWTSHKPGPRVVDLYGRPVTDL